MKKYLITGFSGFVSQYFIDFLEGNQIKSNILGVDIVEDHQNYQYKYVSIEYRKINLMDRSEIEQMIYIFQPDYILHFASYSSVAFSWKNPVLSFQNNTNIFLNLVETIRKLQLKSRVLSIGSSEQYGNINIKHLPLEEIQPLDPVSPYAVARVAQEMLSKVYAESYGVDIVMTRSFNHIGPKQKDIFVISSFAKKIAEIEKSTQKAGKIETGDISIIRDFLDVRDVVKAYYALLMKGKKGEVYNVCSGNGMALSKIIEILANISHTNIYPTINKELVRPNDNRIIVGSNNKLKNETGWTPEISIEQSLADIYQYWKNIV